MSNGGEESREGMTHDKNGEGVPVVEGIGPVEDSIGDAESKEFLDLVMRSVNKISAVATRKRLKEMLQATREIRDTWEGKKAFDAENMRMQVLTVLRCGCGSGKEPAIEQCVDLVHRLIEYGHIGNAASGTIRIDDTPARQEEIVALVCSGLDTKEDGVYIRIIQALLSLIKTPKAGLHGTALLTSIRTIYNVYLNAESGAVRTSARTSLDQILAVVFMRCEDNSSSSQQREEALNVSVPQSPADQCLGEVSSQQHDAFIVFRALCKLAMLELPLNAASRSTPALSKILALELLLRVVNMKHILVRHDRFVYGLRHYLAPAIVSNGMSPLMSIASAAMDIFDVLIVSKHLRPLLKAEIATIFDTIIFRYATSPSVTANRRRRSLVTLSKICADSSALVDLFVNYDCDVEERDIFERMMCLLCDIAGKLQVQAIAPESGNPGGQMTANGGSEQQFAPAPSKSNVELQLIALRSTAAAMKAIRDWSTPIETPHLVQSLGDPLTSSTNASEEVDQVAVEQARDAPHATAFLDGDDKDAEQFTAAWRKKKRIEEAVAIFNKKPKDGVAFLLQKVLEDGKAQDVARFIGSTQGIDATAVGEYMGESDEFAISVMNAYTDLQNFTGLHFDDAIRQYLCNFRLPGEAQKIDRIMQRFASRYCTCNQEAFASADTAFVLAYSVIMLNTDAHNQQVKNKMSKEQFVWNNRGINDGRDLEAEVLETLYDRIVQNEIRLSGDKKDRRGDTAVMAAMGITDPTSFQGRSQMFKRESEQLLKQTKILFAQRKASPQEYTYYRATNVHHARLMFDTSWEPILALSTDLLRKADESEETAIHLGLSIYRNAIAIATTFGMQTESRSFISELVRLATVPVPQVEAKNLECMKVLVAIGCLDKVNLGDLWAPVIRSASALFEISCLAANSLDCYLEHLHISISEPRGSELRSGTPGTQENPDQSTKQSQQQMSRQESLPMQGPEGTDDPVVLGGASPGRAQTRAQTPRQSLKVSTQLASSGISKASINAIFEDSAELPCRVIELLCEMLSSAALEELNRKHPRSFCVQKIVQITSENMHSRTRYQWTRVWDRLGAFFSAALCDQNPLVAFRMCDILVPLAYNFLEEEEPDNYLFQRSFLKPLEVCFASKTTDPKLKQHVLSLTARIVQDNTERLKSGWKSAFTILSMCAEESGELLNAGFTTLLTFIDQYFGIFDDVYLGAIMATVAYVNNRQSKEIALQSVQILAEKCAKTLADGKALSSVKRVKTAIEYQAVFTDEVEAHISAWFPLLMGLTANVKSEWPEVHAASLKALFQILGEYGGNFSSSLWTIIFNGVLIPIFDDVQLLAQRPSNLKEERQLESVTKWATGLGKDALQDLCSVLMTHHNRTEHLFQELLTLIEAWTTQENEALSRDGIAALTLVIEKGGAIASRQEWDRIVETISSAFRDTMPHEIVGPRGGGNVEENDPRPDSNEGVTGTGDEASQQNDPPPQSLPSRGNNSALSAGLSGAPPHAEPENQGAAVDTEQDFEVVEEVDTPLDRSANAVSKRVNFRIVRAKCVAQLLLLNLVQDVIGAWYMTLSTQQVLKLVDAAWSSYEFAHKFNASVEQRFALWRTGFMNQVPNLLKQETTGLLVTIRVLMWMYLDHFKDPKASDLVATRMISMCEDELKTFIALSEASQSKTDDNRELRALAPVVAFILDAFMQISDAQFSALIARFYDCFLDLVDTDFKEVRAAAVRLFRVRVGNELGYGGEQREEFIPRAMLPKTVQEIVFSVSGVGPEANPDLFRTRMKEVPGVYGVRSEMVRGGSVRLFVYGQAKVEVILAKIATISGATSVTIL